MSIPRKIGGGHKLQTYDERDGEYDNRNGDYAKLSKKTPEELKKQAQKELPKKEVTVKPPSKTKTEVEEWGKKNNVDFNGLYEKLPEEIATAQSEHFIKLHGEFPFKPSSGKKIVLRVDDLGGNTWAQAHYSYQDDNCSIAFDTSFPKQTETAVKSAIEKGWSSDASPENYKNRTLSHEYGHLIEYCCLSNYGAKEAILQAKDELTLAALHDYRKLGKLKRDLQKMVKDKRFEHFYGKVMPEIFAKAKEYDATITVPAKVTKTGYSKAPRISGYGASSWAEYFAECFANGVCGAPTPMGKATVDIVRKIKKGEFKW